MLKFYCTVKFCSNKLFRNYLEILCFFVLLMIACKRDRYI